MQRFDTSHGTLRKCNDSGLRPSWGHPRLTSNQKTASSNKHFNFDVFFGVCLLPSRWSRDTVDIQGIELVTIFVAPSACHLFCERDARALIVVFGVLIDVSRDTVEMQGFELAAILVAPSDFQKLLGGALRAPEEPPGRGKSSVLAPSSPRSSAEQIDCIFTGREGALGAPTL